MRTRRLPESRNDWSMMMEFVGPAERYHSGQRIDRHLIRRWKAQYPDEGAPPEVLQLQVPRHYPFARLRWPQGLEVTLQSRQWEALRDAAEGVAYAGRDRENAYNRQRSARQALGCISIGEAVCKGYLLSFEEMHGKPDLGARDVITGYVLSACAFSALGLRGEEVTELVAAAGRGTVYAQMSNSGLASSSSVSVRVHRLFEVGAFVIGPPFTPEEAAQATLV